MMGLGLGRLGASARGGNGAALSLNFTTGSVPVAVTATGGTNGTRVNSSGVIVAASAGRLDYSPVSAFPSRGILVEPARTNNTRNSATLDGAGSASVGGTYVANSGVAPDGNTAAGLFTCTAAGAANCYRELTLLTNLTTATTYTYSVYVKAGTGRYFTLDAANDNGAAWFSATFDLQTATVTQTSAGASGTYTSSSITDAGGGWYRVTVTGSFAAYTGVTYFELCFTDTGTPTHISFGYPTTTGAFTGTYYIWGAQVDVASTVSTYIATTAAAVTRTADQLAFTVPAGVSTLRVTFDDATTQDKAVSPGALTWTSADLNKTRVTSIVSV